ncbi:Aste57867_22852 [Aphanomyces stellatus]|uniref:Aste57867_22852 protein n=1 Tax=Aphanomyces stellatus TaxID=120398 RepID=A0A485LLV9_9STRA|nr:hypothetical protein As57867_022781 [Aphanomyces stellatus]VFT99503.1 Aste57867_22852 [Aphanomyces stellatus]
MVEVSLNCMVVGGGTPFSIDIDAGKKVDHLKDKIKEKKVYLFPAYELQLYRVDGLAQDEDEQGGSPFSVNIAADETVDDLKDKTKKENKNTISCDAKELELYRVDGLAQDEDDQIVYNGITIDMPNCSLDDFRGSTKKLAALSLISECFEEADVNIRWKIHVLVVVPEGAVSATSSTLAGDDALLQKIEEAMERQFKKQKKRKCIAFSDISTAKLNKVINGLNVIVVSGKEPDRRKAKEVRGFEWDPSLREDQQIAEYSQYLRGHLNATLQQTGLC